MLLYETCGWMENVLGSPICDSFSFHYSFYEFALKLKFAQIFSSFGFKKEPLT
jgi:hypothetical protein